MSLGLLDWPRRRARKDNWSTLCLKTLDTEFDSSSSDEDFKKKSARRYFTEYFHTLVTKIPQSSNVKREQKWIQKEEIPALSFLSAASTAHFHIAHFTQRQVNTRNAPFRMLANESIRMLSGLIWLQSSRTRMCSCYNLVSLSPVHSESSALPYVRFERDLVTCFWYILLCFYQVVPLVLPCVHSGNGSGAALRVAANSFEGKKEASSLKSGAR